MIAQLRGRVAAVFDGFLVLDVNGVGYGLNVPAGLAGSLSVGQDAEIVTYHHIKENANELFGFEDWPSRSLFEMLISVSGVGPKSALAIMSLGPQEKISQAIAGENVAFISAASGIGQRSAQRICSELKDKLGITAEGGWQEAGEDEVMQALLSLGYSRQQAAKALTKVDRKKPSQEQVKEALKSLS